MKTIELNEEVSFSFVASLGERANVRDRLGETGLPYSEETISKTSTKFIITGFLNQSFLHQIGHILS